MKTLDCLCLSVSLFLMFNFSFEAESKWGRGCGGQRTDSSQPTVGLELANYEIMT